MFNSISKFHRSAVSLIAASMFLIAGSAIAGPKEDKVKPKKPGPDNILDIALAVNAAAVENEVEGVGEFEYLYAAVLCLEGDDLETVLGILTGSDKHTLFAPTNEAFRSLQRALTEDPDLETSPELSCLVDDLLETEGALYTVLAYHLTEGRRFSNSVFNANEPKEVEMIKAGSIITMPNLTIMDGALNPPVGLVLTLEAKPEISLINVNASNGVIHTIDAVLVPALD